MTQFLINVTPKRPGRDGYPYNFHSEAAVVGAAAI